MSLSKRLPNTNVTRLNALRSAFERNDHLPVADRFLTAATQSRLAGVYHPYQTRMQAVVLAEATYLKAAADKGEKRDLLEAHVKSFCDQIFSSIRLKRLTDEHKFLYGLKYERNVYPNISTDRDLMQVARDLINGEQTRIGQGGAPLPLPTLEELEQVYNDFQTAFSNTSTQKDALDTAQEAVDALRKEANGVIKKVWGEVNAHFNEYNNETKRDKARSWGVVYIHPTVKASAAGTVHDRSNGKPLRNVKITVDEDSGARVARSNKSGAFKVYTSHSGKTTLRFARPGFVTATHIIDKLPQGGEVTGIAVVLEKE